MSRFYTFSENANFIAINHAVNQTLLYISSISGEVLKIQAKHDGALIIIKPNWHEPPSVEISEQERGGQTYKQFQRGCVVVAWQD